ncbi:hypothetical protein BDU57DRAFT_157378 [Ampelomyces quisqualis]|uniref:Uncharacterized protein n=1 Tax=Ampelomyces quisqualis TaxID=50730 RepID=A0A6A5QXI3_AMPQU|nr:hypothetical protein BDU57DRAFT_157378 [Ampelomyces quisqualis]
MSHVEGTRQTNNPFASASQTQNVVHQGAATSFPANPNLMTRRTSASRSCLLKTALARSFISQSPCRPLQIRTCACPWSCEETQSCSHVSLH